MAALSASLQVDFAPGDGPPLTLEYADFTDGGRSDSVIKLRLYPDVPAIVRATAGTAVLAESRTRPVIYEIIKFTGEIRSRPKYPIVSGFSYKSLQVAFDKAGNAVIPTLTYDPVTGEVVSNLAFYGGVQIGYTTGYRIVHYTPVTTVEPSAGGTGAVTVQIGTVLAYWQGQVATLEIELGFEEDKFKYIELYRIISNIVLDKEGAWEEPPGWPDSVSSPPYPTTNSEGPDPDNSFTDERPHEIARINKSGQIDIAAYFVNYAKPYTGTVNYRPAYKIRKGTVREGYEEAFKSVDWGIINTRLAKYYPGVTG